MLAAYFPCNNGPYILLACYRGSCNFLKGSLILVRDVLFRSGCTCGIECLILCPSPLSFNLLREHCVGIVSACLVLYGLTLYWRSAIFFSDLQDI